MSEPTMRGEVVQEGHAKCSEVAGGDIKHGVGLWAAGPLCSKRAWGLSARALHRFPHSHSAINTRGGDASAIGRPG